MPFPVEIEKLYVKYGKKTVLEDINMIVKDGDFVVILGPNGAGKSTLLKTIVGLVRPYRGTVKVYGYPPWTREARLKVGYVAQKEHVNDNVPLKVIDVVLMGIYFRKKFPRKLTKEDYERAIEALKRVGLKGLENELFKNLSGGQKQRVLIARALVGDPPLLLLDEPFSALDIVSSTYIAELLASLNEDGKTIVVVSHDLTPLIKYVNKVALLNRRLIAYGSPREVIRPELLRETYGVEIPIVEHEGLPLPVIGDQHVY